MNEAFKWEIRLIEVINACCTYTLYYGRTNGCHVATWNYRSNCVIFYCFMEFAIVHVSVLKCSV